MRYAILRTYNFAFLIELSKRFKRLESWNLEVGIPSVSRFKSPFFTLQKRHSFVNIPFRQLRFFGVEWYFSVFIYFILRFAVGYRIR